MLELLTIKNGLFKAMGDIGDNNWGTLWHQIWWSTVTYLVFHVKISTVGVGDVDSFYKAVKHKVNYRN